MGKILFLCFVVLLLLMGLAAWVRSHPLHHDWFHAGLAWLFVLLVISWFTAELIRGGGDPNRR